MIAIAVVLDDSGLVKNCRVKGHAGAGKPGHDIVCAAVSVLIRTAQSTLTGRKGITVRSEAPQRGVFTMEIVVQNGEGRDFLAGISAFLVEGLLSVAMEHPKNCSMTVTKERRK